MMGYMYHIPDTEIGFYSLGVSLSEYGWLIPDAFREVLFSRTAKDDAIGRSHHEHEGQLLSDPADDSRLWCWPSGDPHSGGRGISAGLPGNGDADCGHHPDELFQDYRHAAAGAGQKGVYLGMLSASVAVNILCNTITIPLWGKMGAAVASVVSYAVAGFVFLGYYLKTYQIPLSAVFVFSPAEKAKLTSKIGAVKRKLGKKKAV